MSSVGVQTYSVVCRDCRARLEGCGYATVCSRCGGSLGFTYEPSSTWQGSESRMWRYRGLLPVGAGTSPVTLGEGGTPLLAARWSPSGCRLSLKNESANPTGSHKDRALAVGITKATEFGFATAMLYSDGSTALASAAYAARAGIRNITLVPRGTPDGRLVPLAAYGSAILEYQGDSAEALDWTREACRALSLYETTTYRRVNPYEAEGPKTISLEIFEQLGDVPDWVVVPVGGGATIAAIRRGFLELESRGLIARRPRLAGVLPAGYTLLEEALRQGVANDSELRAAAPREVPPTIQAKIAMRFPPDGVEAIEAIRESDGRFFYSSDEEAIRGQAMLGREGIFAEPSPAGVMAAVERIAAERADQTIVAVVTGSGFREIGAIRSYVAISKTAIHPDSGIAELRSVLDATDRR